MRKKCLSVAETEKLSENRSKHILLQSRAAKYAQKQQSRMFSSF